MAGANRSIGDAQAALLNYTVSPVVSINGESTETSLASVAGIVNSDPDAAFNQVVWSHGSAPSAGSYRNIYTTPGTYVYPGT